MVSGHLIKPIEQYLVNVQFAMSSKEKNSKSSYLRKMSKKIKYFEIKTPTPPTSTNYWQYLSPKSKVISSLKTYIGEKSNKCFHLRSLFLRNDLVIRIVLLIFCPLTNLWINYFFQHFFNRVKMNSRLCQHHGQSILLDSGWSVETHVVDTLQQLRFPIDHQVKQRLNCLGGGGILCSSISDQFQTHSLSSSKVFTEYRGEVGSRCRTSTWFLFRTRERRISLFNRDCSARSTLSPSLVQPPFSALSGTMLPAQVENHTKVRQTPRQLSGKIR